MIIDGVRCDHELELIKCVGRTVTGLLVERRMCAQCRILCYVRRVPGYDKPFVVCDARSYPPDWGEWDKIVERFFTLSRVGEFPS